MNRISRIPHNTKTPANKPPTRATFLHVTLLSMTSSRSLFAEEVLFLDLMEETDEIDAEDEPEEPEEAMVDSFHTD